MQRRIDLAERDPCLGTPVHADLGARIGIEEGLPGALPASGYVDPAVAHDPIHPTVHPRARLPGRLTQQRLLQRHLAQIVGIGRVPRERTRKPPQTRQQREQIVLESRQPQIPLFVDETGGLQRFIHNMKILCKEAAVMRRRWYSIGLVPLLASAPAFAQLVPTVPHLPAPLSPDRILGRVDDGLESATDRIAQQLEAVRVSTAARLVRAYPDRVALDPDGNPARAGEVVLDDPDETLTATLRSKGYTLLAREEVLGVRYARLGVPRSRSLGQAIRELRKLGARGVTADQLHATSGSVPAMPASADTGSGTAVGVIDGGVAGATLRAGFASGAPRDSDHATAVASLIGGAGIVRGGLPGARIASADVYGTDPAGGNATAIARAIGWMVEHRVSVVTISLVGPANPVLGKVIAAAQARGTAIVAAVGNHGPAAPPAYPASYPGVLAITAVDARGRVLIEAGRAGHLDYAAPGADMLAMAANGRTMRVRGTSFAAPLVAATLARFYPAASPGQLQAAIAKVDAVARDAGAHGSDPVFGRGIVCEACRTPAR